MRIVIVEDNRANLMTLSRLASHVDDALVSPYGDAAEALEATERESCDLVVVGHAPPELDGLEFLRLLRAIPAAADVPVAMIVGENKPALLKSALEAGATEFLARPLNPVEVATRLRNLMALRRAQESERERAAAGAMRASAAADGERELVFAFARAIELREGDSGRHAERVGRIARDMGAQLGLAEPALEELFLAAPLRDVGKIGAPDAILGKPGALTLEERATMQQHTVRGHALLARSRSPLLRKAAAIALTHHERYDGAGYPHGLKGEDIPLDARIVAVADVFDALTSRRPFKPAWEVARAREYLKASAGAQFDPACVAAFLAIDPPPAGG